ncbi:SphA family protein [Xanthobacter sp. ZOL 2024]
MSRRHLGACAAFATLLAAGPTHATENGAIAYPIGVNTIMAGAMPAPGETWYQNYAVYYSAGAFTDGQGNSAVPGFSASVAVNAGRLFHTWNVDLGPLLLASGIVVPVMNANVSTAFGSDSNFGFGDITLQPIDLGWSNADHTFFGYVALDVFVPTGGPTSNNFYTFNPHTTFTWLALPTLDISGAIGVEFHSKNTDTDYKSGALFFLDWGVNWHAFDKVPGLAVGLGGYVIKQFSDDELDGLVYLDGFRQQGFAVGPQISYGGPNGAIGLKWQHEFAAENRPEGDRFWLQFMLPLRAP